MSFGFCFLGDKRGDMSGHFGRDGKKVSFERRAKCGILIGLVDAKPCPSFLPTLFMVSIQPCQLFFSKLLKIQMKVIIFGISQLYHTLPLNIHIF